MTSLVKGEGVWSKMGSGKMYAGLRGMKICTGLLYIIFVLCMQYIYIYIILLYI